MKVQTAIFALLLSALATPAYADPVSGYVYSDGKAAMPSGLYKVAHHRYGHYTIKFTTPMEPRASCVVTPISKPTTPYGVEVWRMTESDTECSVAFHISGTSSRIDSDFSFIAVPMSN